MRHSVPIMIVSLVMWALCALALGPVLAAEEPPAPAGLVYLLDQFGPIGKPAEAEATLKKASEELIAKGGGVIIIPANAPENWTPTNLGQTAWREPPPPAPATRWGYTKGVTILDYRGGTVKVYEPQMSGMVMSRTLSLPEGQSANHWDYHPMVQFDNSVIRGTTSYHDWIVEPVKAGKNQRIYVRTLRGLFPGQFVNTLGGGPVNRLYIQSLHWDPERRLPYVIADVDTDVGQGALLSNKTHANVMRMDTYSHTENQTFDVMNVRHNYSQGDNYMYYAGFEYMGDVHSTAGDENGVLYAAFPISLTNIFRGEVESFNAATAELKYKSARNAHTLGTGRPMINLNKNKWITAGTVLIVRPGSYWEIPSQAKDPVFEGKTYPTTVEDGALRMGGLIRFSADAPITPDVVGRYFAVDETNEMVPSSAYSPEANGVRRWYMIDSVKINPDGTKEIKIVRHWWGAKPAGSPTLYRPENYTWDGHVKPLKYIIAPGANVYDVSRGVKDDGPYGGQYVSGALERIVLVAPGPHTGTPMDFAAGDPIEQAIGPDPFKPIPFRSWMFENVPGPFPAPVFDIANHGATTRHAVLTVAGGTGTLEGDAKRAEGRPAWENIMVFNSACYDGIVFGGDTANAAITFAQPGNRPQPIKWLYDNQTREASLTVDTRDGTMRYEGGGMSLPGGAFNVGGISGTNVKAQNLRGVNVTVAEGAKEVQVKFPKAEADADYAVFLEFTWLTNRAITSRTKEGFTVQFETPAPAGASLCWMLVR